MLLNSLLLGWYDDEIKGTEEITLEIQEQVYENDTICDVIRNYFGCFNSNQKLYNKVDCEKTFLLKTTKKFVLAGHSENYSSELLL